MIGSVRGAAGGYILGREPHRLTVADVVDTLHGSSFLGEAPHEESERASAWVIRSLHGRLSQSVRRELEGITVADLSAEIQRLDEARSLMLGL